MGDLEEEQNTMLSLSLQFSRLFLLLNNTPPRSILIRQRRKKVEEASPNKKRQRKYQNLSVEEKQP